MVEALQHSIRALKEEQESVMLIVNSLKDDIHAYEDKTLQHKEVISQQVSESERRSLRQYEGLMQRVNRLEANSKMTNKSIENNNRVIEDIGASIQTVSRKARDLDDQIHHLREIKLDAQEFQVLKKHVKEDTNYALVAFEKMNSRVNEIQRYIHSYQPLNEFETVMKSLDFIFCRKEERQRLAEYFESSKDILLEAIQESRDVVPDLIKSNSM